MLTSLALYPFSAQIASPLSEDFAEALARHLLAIGMDSEVSELVRAGACMAMCFLVLGGVCRGENVFGSRRRLSGGKKFFGSRRRLSGEKQMLWLQNM